MSTPCPSRRNSQTERALVVWFIVNPVSGGGRGEAMLHELQRTLGSTRSHPHPQGHAPPSRFGDGPGSGAPVRYHVQQYTAAAFLNTSMAAHLADASTRGVETQQATVFLLSTEKPGEGVRVAACIASVIAQQRLVVQADRTTTTAAAGRSLVHVVVPVGGDGTLSEVVNGICRGVIAAHHRLQQSPSNDNRDGNVASPSSRSYYFRVLEEKSVLRYLAPAVLYVPTGTGADFAKLKLCVRTVGDCIASLESLIHTLATGTASPLPSSTSTAGTSSLARHALAYYEVDVGRLTFPRTGRVHFFINECSFGMSCDVIARAERLRRTRWMAPLGGTVLFATASALSLLCWVPKDVRVVRLPMMPTLPSWQPSPIAGVEEGSGRPHNRVRASPLPPPHVVDEALARHALTLDHLCSEALQQCVNGRSDKSRERQPSAASWHSAGADGSQMSDALKAAEAIAARDSDFWQDQDALTTADYYAARGAMYASEPAVMPHVPFRERESANVSMNHSFADHVDSGSASCVAMEQNTAEAESIEPSSGLPIIGVCNPLFFAESGAPQSPPATTATATSAVSTASETVVLRDAKLVQRALDLPIPALADSPPRTSDTQDNGASTKPITAVAATAPATTGTAARLRWVLFSSSTISFAVGRWFGGGLHITPHADPADGLLSVTSWRAEIIPFVSGALSLYSGHHTRWPTTAAFDGVRFLLDAADTAESLWVEADGELVEPLPAAIEVAGVLTFLVPLPIESSAEAGATASATDRGRAPATDMTVLSCQPLRFGAAVAGTTRAADWRTCRDRLLSQGTSPSTWLPTGSPAGCEHAAATGGPLPEYIHIYAAESLRWPPPEDEGFFSTMANSAPRWRVCCGACDKLCRFVRRVGSLACVCCQHGLQQVHILRGRGGRRERVLDVEEKDGRVPQRTLDYPLFSARRDIPV